ncbi:MAG: pantetheine-phosphate adenylyltransferase, partial [Simkaniaceae bacterium]|nr:pantetheine-phosphate adenylyltransferase [Simkaniaceae bacterium]
TFAQERKGDAILRSLRNFSDYEYEKTLAETNKNISGIETVFLFPDPEYQSISSTLLREIAERGESLSPFIPEAIEKEVSEILQAAR